MPKQTMVSKPHSISEHADKHSRAGASSSARNNGPDRVSTKDPERKPTKGSRTTLSAKKAEKIKAPLDKDQTTKSGAVLKHSSKSASPHDRVIQDNKLILKYFKSILAMSPEDLLDKQSHIIHHQLNLKSADEFDKRLAALTYHIEQAEHTERPLLEAREIKMKEYLNLRSVDWTDYGSLTTRRKTKAPHKSTGLPSKSWKGDTETLRYRWKLGADVGGSDICLQMLLYVRFSAGIDSGKAGMDKAPKLALSKIRAILFYFDENYREISEEDIEAIYQEIRGCRDPMIATPELSEDDKAKTTHRATENDHGKAGSGESISKSERGYPNPEQLKSKSKQGDPKSKGISVDFKHGISRPGRRSLEATDSSSLSRPLSSTKYILKPPSSKSKATTVWELYLPILSTIKAREANGKPVPDPKYYSTAAEDRTPQEQMWFARDVARDAIFRLTMLHCPPSWHHRIHAEWAMGMKVWGMYHQISQLKKPPSVILEFLDFDIGGGLEQQDYANGNGGLPTGPCRLKNG